MSNQITPALFDEPLVSLVVPTRDRPTFLPILLQCIRDQTYTNYETIVVDDGDQVRVDPSLVAELNGRVLRTEPGSPLGTTLNLGFEAAKGEICFKLDDDDWYGTGYVYTMLAHLLAKQRQVNRPTYVVATGYTIFDLRRWECRPHFAAHPSGGTLVFRREDWAASPFEPVRAMVDHGFIKGQSRLGTRRHDLTDLPEYLAVRHGGAAGNRGHTWTRMGPRTVEDALLERPLIPGGPASFLPPWAIARYRDLQRQLVEDAPSA